MRLSKYSPSTNERTKAALRRSMLTYDGSLVHELLHVVLTESNVAGIETRLYQLGWFGLTHRHEYRLQQRACSQSVSQRESELLVRVQPSRATHGLRERKLARQLVDRLLNLAQIGHHVVGSHLIAAHDSASLHTSRRSSTAARPTAQHRHHNDAHTQHPPPQ